MKIYLNIYDLSKANYYLYSLGFGIYHTGIQIGSSEYHFGGHEGDSTGVCVTEPKEYSSSINYRETLFLGECTLGNSQVNAILEELKISYAGNSYDALSKNCNHFSNSVCKSLLGKSIPGFINRTAQIGSIFRCCLPSSLTSGPNSDPTRTDLPITSKNIPLSSQFIPFKGQGMQIGNGKEPKSHKIGADIGMNNFGYVRQHNQQ